MSSLSRAAALAACGAALLHAAPAAAQVADTTGRDRLLARSLPGILLPVVPLARGGEAGSTTLLVQLSRAGLGEGGQPAVAVGVERAQRVERDSAGAGTRVPLVMGAAVGFLPSAEAGRHEWTAGVHAGAVGPGLRLSETARLHTGLDVAVSFADLSRDPTASLGLRFPVAVSARGSRRVTAHLTPTLAWARFDLRQCNDDGPNDGCGDAGVRVHSTRPRWLLGGGVDVELVPGRVRLLAGAQRLMARGQELRTSLGLAWEP